MVIKASHSSMCINMHINKKRLRHVVYVNSDNHYVNPGFRVYLFIISVKDEFMTVRNFHVPTQALKQITA